MHWSNCSEYLVLISLAQNAVVEVRGAPLVRAVAVGVVLHVEVQDLGGDEELQGVGVVLDAVGAAIEDEDAVHRAAVAEGSASTLINMQCRCKLRFAYILGFSPITS